MHASILRNFLFLVIICGFLNARSATPTISDSIDIKNYTIRLDITDYAGHTISGNTQIRLKALVDNITQIPLDFTGLTVDSVKNLSDEHLIYDHSAELLLIDFISVLNTNDSTDIIIYYHGVPDADGSWGGWYWSGDYSYQLGVGFDAIPHNFGRIWFPCFDNFVERSTYRYEIITEDDKKAYCGGLLESETNNGDGTITWIWNCNQTIPSYLASVAVSTYTSVHKLYEGIEADIPIEIAVKPEDSTDLNNSFINLENALNTFETHYGAYSWDRVGYSVVPFSGGAMEHAMNIAYPLFAVNGTTTWENLYVHELSHHWWGDLITTSKAEEMWINEGWAVYSEHLFNELRYGDAAYKDMVQLNHTEVLHYAAAQDGNNYFPISNVPQTYTYGSTTYKKGADVVHSLRGYLGDDLFFECITSFLETHKFQSVTAADLRDHLSTCSGIDMNDFFDGWVYQAGFPGFEIEDFGYTDYGTFMSICIEQKLHHATNYCNNVPITITFFDADWHKVNTYSAYVSGEHTQIDLPDIEAFYAVIDYDEKINDAVTEDEITIKAPDTYELENAFIDITVNSITDSVYIYAQQYWLPADNFKTTHHGIHLSPDRYWKINGTIPPEFDATAKILYNGQLNLGGGYLDNNLITNVEDSLLLFYRSNSESDWEIYPNYTLNDWGNNNDKRGAFELSKLQTGEYTFGIYNSALPDEPLDVTMNCPDFLEIKITDNNLMKIFPNPADNIISIQLNERNSDLLIKIINSTGDTVKTIPINYLTQSVSVKDLPSGTYQLYVENSGFERIASQMLMIIH